MNLWKWLMASSMAAALLELVQHVFEVEAGRLLPLGVILEGGQKPADVLLRRNEQKGMVERPVVVGVRRDVGPLVRVDTEVEDFWHAQRGERLAPDPQCSWGALLEEHELPVVVPQRHDLGVIVAVNERIAGALVRLAGQIRDE